MNITVEEQAKVWEYLRTGRAIEELNLPVRGGRLDLRGFDAPQARVVRASRFGSMNVVETDPVVIAGARWRGLDLTDAKLGALRFHGCTIENCEFGGADCDDWRLWETSVSDSTFRGAKMRGSALGGVGTSGGRNVFSRVDFSEADLRETAYTSCEMTECVFKDTNLFKVDFQGTVFNRCTFSGKLEEVLFYRHAFRGAAFPPNEMKAVDFRKATFRHVEFRGLDMADVAWPDDGEHIVIEDYVTSLDRILEALGSRTDLPSKRLRVILAMKRKFAGPHQQRGVVSKADVVEAGGVSGLGDLVRMLGTARGGKPSA